MTQQYYACPHCGCTDIQLQVWQHANSGEVYDEAGGYNWCPRCEDKTGDGEVGYMVMVDKPDPHRPPLYKYFLAVRVFRGQCESMLYVPSVGEDPESAFRYWGECESHDPDKIEFTRLGGRGHLTFTDEPTETAYQFEGYTEISEDFYNDLRTAKKAAGS